MLRFGILLLLVSTCSGYAPYGTTTLRPFTNISTTEMNSTSAYDMLCSRTHTNTAFVGVQPYSKLLLYTAGDCFKSCIESYPRCVAVVFYNLHEGDLNNVCYTFDKNSAHEDVALVPERPAHPQDTIRTLEVVPDCYDFNPVPPLKDEYVSSTDTVSQTKRVETTSTATSSSTMRGSDQWSQWSYCSPRAPTQIRTQPCDYGRLINRRRCSYGSMYPQYRTAVVINANVPYPPMGYRHPECHTAEYDQIMTQHVDQMRQICCRPEYVPQPDTRETYGPTPAFIPTCRQVCVPQEPVTNIHISDEDVGGSEVFKEIDQLAESVWTPWSEWSVCSATCGFGTEQRYRMCNGGGICEGESFEHRRCDWLQPCHTWADWTEWSSCQASCGDGVRYRSRYCHLGDGDPRCIGPAFEEDDRCQTEPCPIWSSWSSWSACTATCGPSRKSRTRYCMNGPDGSCPGADREDIDCEYVPCAFWAQWAEWSYCSESCGYGTRQRTRSCIGGGQDQCMGEPVQEDSCVISTQCPMWGEWDEWSFCSASCGYGVSRRTRYCNYGEQCPGDREELKKCSLRDCSTWSQWGEWSYCSASCGEGEKKRTRVCLGEGYCEGLSYESERCMNMECSEWNQWSDYTPCSVTCGYGTQIRTRQCSGELCMGPKIEETACVGLPQCPEWAPWMEWSSCSANCGNGRQTRYRTCMNGINCFGESEENRHCMSSEPCVQWAPWGQWTRCTSECGQGKKSRRRECVTTDGNYPTTGCSGPYEETAMCNDHPCCEWTNWGGWTTCDRMCGNGQKKRVRDCVKPSGEFNLTCCPGVGVERMACNNAPCPTPTQSIIQVGSRQSKKKVVIDMPSPAPCVTYEDCPPYQPPPPPPRPTNQTNNCQWTQWCNWSPCPQSCNYGVTRRHRYCLGDHRCVCNGPSLEKGNCASSEQCRKKK